MVQRWVTIVTGTAKIQHRTAGDGPGCDDATHPTARAATHPAPLLTPDQSGRIILEMRTRALALSASLSLLLAFLVTLAPPLAAREGNCAGRCPLGMSMRHCAGPSGATMGTPMRCCLRAPSGVPVRGPEPAAPDSKGQPAHELTAGPAASPAAASLVLGAAAAASRLVAPRPHQGRWHARGLFTLHATFLI
jgi:hypothetical protein